MPIRFSCMLSCRNVLFVIVIWYLSARYFRWFSLLSLICNCFVRSFSYGMRAFWVLSLDRESSVAFVYAFTRPPMPSFVPPK